MINRVIQFCYLFRISFFCVFRAMRRPRCGLPDKRAAEVDNSARKKRYTLTGQQWDKDHITYRFAARKWTNRTPVKSNM